MRRRTTGLFRCRDLLRDDFETGGHLFGKRSFTGRVAVSHATGLGRWRRGVSQAYKALTANAVDTGRTQAETSRAMFRRLGRKRQDVSPSEMEALAAWERSRLDDFVQTMAAGDPLFRALDEFLHACTSEEALGCLERHPVLASERGVAAMKLVVEFAQQTRMIVLAPAIESRLTWLEQLVASGWGRARAE